MTHCLACDLPLTANRHSIYNHQSEIYNYLQASIEQAALDIMT